MEILYNGAGIFTIGPMKKEKNRVRRKFGSLPIPKLPCHPT
jgi:hypothetical protein